MRAAGGGVGVSRILPAPGSRWSPLAACAARAVTIRWLYIPLEASCDPIWPEDLRLIPAHNRVIVNGLSWVCVPAPEIMRSPSEFVWPS